MLRQVIFLTDGAIANEKEMLATLGAKGGRSRLLLTGIGSARNTYLMARMASVGRDIYTHIGRPDELEARMAALLDTLRGPRRRAIWTLRFVERAIVPARAVIAQRLLVNAFDF